MSLYGVWIAYSVITALMNYLMMMIHHDKIKTNKIYFYRTFVVCGLCKNFANPTIPLLRSMTIYMGVRKCYFLQNCTYLLRSVKLLVRTCKAITLTNGKALSFLKVDQNAYWLGSISIAFPPADDRVYVRDFQQIWWSNLFFSFVCNHKQWNFP